MPYIVDRDRGWLHAALDRLMHQMCLMDDTGPGVLNYIITRIVIAWLGKDPNYERFNAAIGALESAKLELYRRAISPYEDKKIDENGDVYDIDEYDID